MNKHCESYMNDFLSLDAGERLPLSLTLHLLFCKECRSQVRAMSSAQKNAVRPFIKSIEVDSPSVINAMKKLDPQWKPKVRPVSMIQWIISGIVMISALIFFALICDLFVQSQAYMVAYAFITAGAVTAYCAVFIASNLDFFVKKISSKTSDLSSLSSMLTS